MFSKAINKNLYYTLVILSVFVLFLSNLIGVEGSSPTFKPTVKPTKKPTSKPVHIYGDNAPVHLTEKQQQGIVGALTILLFILMATEILAPEILFLIALMIITGCQIISITDTLSGNLINY